MQYSVAQQGMKVVCRACEESLMKVGAREMAEVFAEASTGGCMWPQPPSSSRKSLTLVASKLLGYLSGCVGIFFQETNGRCQSASEGNNGAAESNVESQYSSCPEIAHRLCEKAKSTGHC